MKSFLALAFGAALALAGTSSARAGEATPPPRDQGPVYVTTYFEVTPGAIENTIANLKEYRDAVRQESGAMQSEIFQEVGTPSRFVTYDEWRDWAAYDAHATAPSKVGLYLKQRFPQYGPPDSRTHLQHFGAPSPGTIGPDSVIILSHLDVTPNGLPKLIEIMKPLGEGSAKDPGMIRYQLIRQAPGVGNHFRVFEVWASERAFDQHNVQAHTTEFRNELLPMLGTPYDQRRYKLVN
jgi:quinol monooxygenase YgiN